MEVKKILSVLSEPEEDFSYITLLFDNRAEVISFIIFILSFFIFIITAYFKQDYYALSFATLSIISLLFHSVASVIREFNFLKNPIKSYVKSLNKGVQSDNKVLEKLSKYPNNSLAKMRTVIDNENVRINKHISFISGSIDKVGIFPSLLALFYAFHNYQSSSQSSMLSYIILGAIIGIYLAVLFLKKVTNWQDWCLYILNEAIIENERKATGSEASRLTRKSRGTFLVSG